MKKRIPDQTALRAASRTEASTRPDVKRTNTQAFVNH
jgi:hypothetical protein